MKLSLKKLLSKLLQELQYSSGTGSISFTKGAMVSGSALTYKKGLGGADEREHTSDRGGGQRREFGGGNRNGHSKARGGGADGRVLR